MSRAFRASVLGRDPAAPLPRKMAIDAYTVPRYETEDLRLAVEEFANKRTVLCLDLLISD